MDFNKAIKGKLSGSLYSLTTDSDDFSIIRTIVERLNEKYTFNVLDYIETITKVGFANDEGFYFIANDSYGLSNVLMSTKNFVRDSDTLIGKAASLMTNGESYREIGKKSTDRSLHFALNNNECNVHLDETLFTIIGPLGKVYYSLDAPQHICYDLIWRDFFVRRAYNIKYFGLVANRIHPFVPNSENEYKKAGIIFNLYRSNSFSLQAKLEYEVNFALPNSISSIPSKTFSFSHPEFMLQANVFTF